MFDLHQKIMAEIGRTYFFLPIVVFAQAKLPSFWHYEKALFSMLDPDPGSEMNHIHRNPGPKNFLNVFITPEYKMFDTGTGTSQSFSFLQNRGSEQYH